MVRQQKNASLETRLIRQTRDQIPNNCAAPGVVEEKQLFVHQRQQIYEKSPYRNFCNASFGPWMRA